MPNLNSFHSMLKSLTDTYIDYISNYELYNTIYTADWLDIQIANLQFSISYIKKGINNPLYIDQYQWHLLDKADQWVLYNSYTDIYTFHSGLTLLYTDLAFFDSPIYTLNYDQGNFLINLNLTVLIYKELERFQ